jgi:hypothetical protein
MTIPLFPYIAHQKNFGYSDVTPSQNSNSGVVQEMFNHASERLKKMQQTYFCIGTKDRFQFRQANPCSQQRER